MWQISLFDGAQKFKIKKPIRLVELFAGYGSTALALDYLGVKYEHWHIAEWAVKSIQAYKDLHCEEDDTDYSETLTKEEVFAELFRMGISADYNAPMSFEQIKRMGESKARRTYNNIRATRNLVSVCNIKGADLEIADTDKYDYIMTYSFPCQDLSNSGKRAGMEKGSGTRSGLLWEVERLLLEMKERPQVLLMENVPDVIGSKNMKAFSEWIATLDRLGYKSKWQVLNATEFNVPQNRARCFMVSVLGDWYYDFPKPVGCGIALKDVLEENVDESYYLKPEVVISLIKHKERHDAEGHGFGWSPIDIDGGGTQGQLKQRADTDRKQTLLLSQQATKIDKFTQVANTLMARDYKGFGNQPMTAIMEVDEPMTRGGSIVKANGIDIGKSTEFFRGEYEGKSRTLRADGTSGVVLWKD